VGEKHVRESRFLSWALRHAPEKIGLDLDSQGWAQISELVECAARHGVTLTEAIIHEVAETDGKGRYEIRADGKRIRALYGHSIDVDLGLEPKTPPQVLYHGTATRFLNSVMLRGLNPGRRQYVHLSTNPQAAVAVGRRHGNPVVLEIDAKAMHSEGIEFFQTAPETWIVRMVPVRFIRVTFRNASSYNRRL
jgi:putative RNA 2'-phosphotransferase